ncbi:hypothetical protein [Xylanivirga thermophila]|jgi:hypothetical protein|uniref:hypothetical protein n=1 Tax=Xylanivirga thermophila TaxID=2496273 RepID=UPI00101C2E9A|nr:hypothetical protein [Xylanivirga thermophila]
MKKVLVITVCLLFIASIGLNIYQYRKIIDEKEINMNMAKYYMSTSEVTFMNAFAVTDQDIMEYIADPANLSNFIESIQAADLYYLAASKCVTEHQLNKGQSFSYIQSRDLINGYLQELRSYRKYLISNKNGSYVHTDQIAMVIADLKTIANWLSERSKNKNFQVYNDDDFYKEVYDNLNSDIKGNYFIGFSGW